MVTVDMQYKWTILGGVDVGLVLDLELKCKVKGTRVVAVELSDVTFVAATFTTERKDTTLTVEKCADGLPAHARRKYETMFRKAYDEKAFVQRDVFDKAIGKAVGEYYEQMAGI